jgi:cytochrome P450
MTDPKSFDPYALTADSVFDVYRDLREQCPAARSEQYGGFWVLSRYRDVFAALRDHGTYSSQYGVHIPQREGHLRIAPLGYDPPEHTIYRGLLAPALSQEAVSRLEPFIKTLVADLVGPVAARGGGDLVAEVALPLPLQVICRILGLSAEAAQTVRALTEQMWTDFERLGDEARWPLANFLLGEVNARREHPRDDFLSQLVQAKYGDRPLTETELAALVVSLANAGHQTTMNAAGNALLHLAQHQDHQLRLRQDPKLIPAFVEESLRYYNPTHMFARTLTREVSVDGATLQQGDKTMLVYAAANRDPEQFPDPDQFILDRAANRHLAFGWGIHFCLGALLARTELRILLEEFAQRHPPFRLAGEPTHSRMEGGHHMGVASLPVEFVTEC